MGIKLFNNKSDCCGCGACEAICPNHAIEMVFDKDGFLYPKIDEKNCVNCNQCMRVCPYKEYDTVKKKNHYYGVRNKDDEIRLKSSSGGMFSLLAKFIIEKSGVVFAAGYDSYMRVVHKKIDRFEDLDKVRQTKYVQSCIFRKNCASVPEERSAIPLQAEQSSAG